MRSLVGEILPLAIVVTASPINIAAAILLLFSKRPIANATSYLVGFTVGVAAVLTGVTLLADVIGLSPASGLRSDPGRKGDRRDLKRRRA